MKIMKKLILLFNIALVTYSCFGQNKHSVPVESKNYRTYFTLRIGEIIIPDMLLDTGFAFDGLMLFNPAYMDSLDYTNAAEVRIGGAGSGDDATALIIDSVNFHIGDIEIEHQPLIILRENPGLYSNGLIGYSIFGHFITEFDYDNNVMTLHDSDKIKVDNSWGVVPLYFKNNNIPWLNAFVVIENEEPVPVSFNRSLYPSSDQIDELFKERRTIRDYKGEKIDRLLLEKLAGYTVYAPTHNFNFRVIIIDDGLIIDLIDSIILKFTARIYSWFYKNKVIYSLLRVFTPSREHEYLKAKPKLESAQYALYNLDLYAQVKGLACRNLVGNQAVINRNKKFRKKLGIKPAEKIFGTITLGYPAIKFKNKVYGKNVIIQWNDNVN